ncbi:class I SAM-dependent methyltransferase [Desulfoluna spongiiphila]|uniref:class I SAM-dependent methyltransferase n=1 Tax=Desulfoluna spongiiphila TaxID=419481 RepID=UPI0012527161|nr:class I SAM-dependent methyltransferase [Desulfoluna spongiiphila]VVS94866.1 s-adenosyl-l-methionine-dependent methyltransferase [Desulfoluna spongiiphila]
MKKQEQNKAQAYNQVKLHYERAAENRNKRLLTSKLNAAKVNHRERLKTIAPLLKRIGIVKQGIDVGTGTGVWSEVLVDYCDKVTGIDFAEQNIKIACEKAADTGFANRLVYIVGDAQQLSGLNDHSYDIATHVSVLQHLPDQRKSLESVNRILKKKGHLIVVVHNRGCIYNRSLNLQHKRGATIAINKYNTLDEIVGLLEETGFQVKKIRLVWLFILDFLMIGVESPRLIPFEPLRKALLVIFGKVGGWMGRFQLLNPLFREIVILAQKR